MVHKEQTVVSAMDILGCTWRLCTFGAFTKAVLQAAENLAWQYIRHCMCVCKVLEFFCICS